MAIILDGTNGISDVDGSASTPAIRGTDANTGIYFGTDTIGFSEGGAQCGEFDSSANFKFNSGYGSVATAYGCRAWVNFDGTGTVAIRASGNVSSITDVNTGDYRVNFTTAMPDSNYSTIVTTCHNIGTAAGAASFNTTDQTASQSNVIRVITFASAQYDSAIVTVAIFR